jgi:hypothetical protein
MKRLIVAASLAAAALPALAVEIGKPYEQLDVDRALPNIAERVVQGERTRYAAAAGETRSDAVDSGEARPAVSPFAHQHDFIAPAP